MELDSRPLFLKFPRLPIIYILSSWWRDGVWVVIREEV